MTKKIISIKTAGHYQWGDKCDSWVLVETTGLSVKQEKMPAGTREKLHMHSNAQQCFFILKGSATFYVDGTKLSVAEQESLRVEPNSKHYIANETVEELEFLVISQPSTNNDRFTIE
jgi:mannose-6-phosphate isomerase-like protein (cupin superfamily)